MSHKAEMLLFGNDFPNPWKNMLASVTTFTVTTQFNQIVGFTIITITFPFKII